jgi:hypothetical protein
MSLKFAKGSYQVENKEKYAGLGTPYYRSSWELAFMRFCDNNPAIIQWASESIKIPYRDPLTGKQTIYVPDFFIVYIDKNQKKHAELIEIKPANQTLIEKVGKNAYNQAQYVRNMVKWKMANIWCSQNNCKFRILNENDIFQQTGKKSNK